MIDKLNNINIGNNQNKRVSDEIRDKETNIKVSKDTQTNSEKTNDDVKISSELKVKDMSVEAPIDSVKVSAIKDAIARTIKCHNKETGDCIELIEYQQPEAIKRSKSINSLGFNHLALNIKEIDNLYLELKNLGLEFITKPEYSPNGKVKVAFCRDFEGNLLELVEEVA